MLEPERRASRCRGRSVLWRLNEQPLSAWRQRRVSPSRSSAANAGSAARRATNGWGGLRPGRRWPIARAVPRPRPSRPPQIWKPASWRCGRRTQPGADASCTTGWWPWGSPSCQRPAPSRMCCAAAGCGSCPRLVRSPTALPRRNPTRCGRWTSWAISRYGRAASIPGACSMTMPASRAIWWPAPMRNGEPCRTH